MSAPERKTFTGFIVHGFVRSIRGASTLCLLGRCSDHSTFAVLVSNEPPGFCVREPDAHRARSIVGATGVRSRLKTMDGVQCVRFAFPDERRLREAGSKLRREGIRTYEADIDAVDGYLLDRGIHGTVTISGEPQQGKHVDHIFVDPEIGPAVWKPEVSVLSVDIETSIRETSRINVIGFQLAAPWLDNPVEEVLYANLDNFGESGIGEEGRRFVARYCKSERELLETFFRRLGELDPDIITGWNVVDFDWNQISTRASALGIDQRFGRSDEPARFLAARRRRSPELTSTGAEPVTADSGPETGPRPMETAAMFIPGRQVIDGLRLLRYGPENFREQSLQYVSHEVLGVGKTIEYQSSADKLAEIDRLGREDPEALCRYCLQDAALVQRILAKTGLLELTIMRCVLIGVSLARAWMSIRSFDFIYIEAMHRRGIVAPTLGVDALSMGAAPGGAILTPEPGVFDGVMVFDFKSLYPSVIRTFNIDPVGLQSGAESATDTSRYIVAPNGAAFSRDPGILPDLLDRFFSERDAAKARNDQVASYVFKIVMNSFYGVLGAGGCRFAGVQLAGAITSFGQRVLRWCRRLLVDMKYRVIYGDTDSLFVLSHHPEDPGSCFAEGAALAATINGELARYVESEYGVHSRLELEFEKVYRHFFLPALRTQGGTVADGEPRRGRAKGYAGLIAENPESTTGGSSRLEVKGMEAVRRDWTPLAQEFQLTILRTLFDEQPIAERSARLIETIRILVRKLRAGDFDNEIVYSRSLRKMVSDYTKSQPPHVKAALLLPPSERQGTIRYVMTLEGPQPVNRRTAPIDYDHYVEKQLRPIALAFSESLGPDIARALDSDQQLTLFGS